jgi:hypothetical protein
MATDGWVVATTRVLGALSLLAVGVIHLQQYDELYHAIPTIGTLFLLNFAGAVVVSAGLLSPLERLLGRWGGLAVVALAVIGIGQAVMQFVFLAISEQRPLFGFQEPGYDPAAIRATRVTEIATVVFLTTFLAARAVRRRSKVGARASAPTHRDRHDTPVG